MEKQNTISSFQKSWYVAETKSSQRDVCRGILKIPLHLHIYCEVMPFLLTDLSTWAFSCNCALKEVLGWANQADVGLDFTFFFFCHSKSNQNLLAIRHFIYLSVKGKIYIQALFSPHCTLLKQWRYIILQFKQVLLSFEFCPCHSPLFGSSTVQSLHNKQRSILFIHTYHFKYDPTKPLTSAWQTSNFSSCH